MASIDLKDLSEQQKQLNFGTASPDHHQANMRAYEWNLQKEWLLRGAIPADDEKLASDVAGPGFHLKANTNHS